MEAQAGSTHDPILIEGDSDLCNTADLVGNEDQADGIINCDTADGSRERPYIVRDWVVTWDPSEACRVAPDQALCGPLPPCSLTSVPAAFAVCGTRKHIRIENVEVWNAEIAREVGSVRVPAAAVVFSNVDHLSVSGLRARAGGIAVFVEAGKPVPTLPATESPIVIEGLDARAWSEKVENAVLGPVPDDEDITQFPVLSIVRVVGVQVELRAATIDAVTRDVGIDVNATDPQTSFALRDSFVSNASTEYALQMTGVKSAVERNVFRFNGAAGDSGAVRVFGGSTIIQQNRFELQGHGVMLNAEATGDIRENVFIPASQPSAQSRSLFHDSSGFCNVRLNYNDLAGTTVVNDATDCTLDARYNWWDGAPSTAGEGNVQTDPVLTHSIHELPRVRLAGPANGTQVHGSVVLHGVVEADPLVTPERVDVSAHKNEWSDVRSVNTTGRWSLTWDLTGAPLGPLELFVRACGEGPDCGLPSSVHVIVIERPLPPIAILQANPRIVLVGEVVVLDATLSYSPQERPIRAYRFDVGTGEFTGWRTSSTYETTYSSPGERPVSVQVRDAQGLVSENLPPLIVRVVGSEEPGADTPGATFLMGAVGFLAAVVWRRHHK